jgi:ferredoxin
LFCIFFRIKIAFTFLKSIKEKKMAVMITETCVSCGDCAGECPVAAILDDSKDRNPFMGERFYVKPEACVECVGHADVPRCAEACPTEGCIVWDMPYTEEFSEYYEKGNSEGKYKIRVHKKKGLMLPTVKEKPFIETVPLEERKAHSPVLNFFKA